MHTRRLALALTAAALILYASPVRAQINPSHLTGTIKDAQSAVLPGVTVTASSPALLGVQTVVSEANGTYRFPSLPSGTYALKFELSGFQPQVRPAIVLATGQTLTIDVTLQLANLQETVTVSGEAPVVDKQSTGVGYVQTTAQLTGVPSSTDLWGALAQTPGVRMQGIDVGGSHKSQNSGYEAFGMNGQIRIVTDGVDTTEGTSSAGIYQDYFAQNEVAVSAAGQDVTMNSPGAAIVSTIKSGGNKFSGLENLAYEPGSFVGNNTDAGTARRGDPAGQPNLQFWEGHAELGGPIVTDRLWFYSSFNHFKINKDIAGIDPSLATDLGVFNNFTTKESYKPDASDTLLGYYQWGKKQKPLRGIGAATPKESALAQTSPSWMYNGRWQHTWSNRMFSEVNVGGFGYVYPEQPNVPYQQFPPTHDLATGVDSGAGWFNAGGNTGPFVLSRGKPQGFANLTYFLPTNRGSHDLKFGFEFVNDRSTNTANGTAGPVLYLNSNGRPNEVRVTDYGDATTFGSAWTQSSDYDRRYALYAQDRYMVSSNVTITAGLRYDRQRPYYSSAVRQPLLSYVFQPTTVPGASLLTANDFAPRLGLTWDPRGNSRTVAKAFWGRYYFNYADTLSGADPGAPNYQDRIFNDLNGNGILDGPQELGRIVNSYGGASTKLDPGLKTPYADEMDLSIDQQVWGEGAFRVAFVRKMVRNLYVAVNQSLVGQFTVPYSATVNVINYDGSKAGQVVGQQTFALVDTPSGVNRNNNVITNIPGALGGSSADYSTIELAINKRFGEGLFINANYDYQWRTDLRSPGVTGAGNSNSNLNTDPIGSIGVGSSAMFFQVNPAVSPLQSTTVWDSKVSARYELPLDIGTAVSFQAQSGWDYAPIFTVTLPGAGTRSFFAAPLSGNRSDNLYLLALRVDKTIVLRGKTKVTVMADLFNALNTNAVTNWNIANGARFNQINATVDPRTFQLGFRFEF